MSIFFNVLLLLSLFFVLGYFADLVVYNIKFIAKALKLRLFILGIILGIVTTLPELAVGINASINGVSSLAIGNLLGGVMVILGLVLGLSLLLNRRLDSSNIIKSVVPATLLIFLPLPLGLDGHYGVIDGLLMIVAYAFLLFYLYKSNRPKEDTLRITIHKKEILKSVFLAILGIVLVLLVSDWIVTLSVVLLSAINLSEMAIGFLVFAIGTNLPEITVVFVSWKRKSSELSLSHLLSSAFTNILVLGVLINIKDITFSVDASYYFLMIFLSLMLILFSIFTYTGKKITKKEGIILFFLYLMFVLSNLLLLL